jgi:hypothetical protein
VIPARDCEQVRAVLNRLGKPHDDFRLARSQNPHAFRFAEHRRRLLPEAETPQRERLIIEVDERRQHDQLTPSLDVVEAGLSLFNPNLLILRGRRLRQHRSGCDHHRRRGEFAKHSRHSWLLPVPSTRSNQRTSELDRD